MLLIPGKQLQTGHLQADDWRAIVPRPIAFVSSVDEQGESMNLAPFSFFCGACARSRRRCCFVPAVRAATAAKKDTLKNVLATKEFVVNIVSEEIAADR
jgi:flavin reductase (DIM6/NTAB) family NADH-FMN oxidoreductase RutF